VFLPALALTVALVVQDQAPLRATARENAPRQTTLTRGDWLEVRGERQGYLQVYDHRRERPGYVRPAAVRSYVVDEAAAPKLEALIDYLKDGPGEESLGIAYVALYLRAAPPQALGAGVFDALGTMADRLARRAWARSSKGADGSLTAELELAANYGVKFVTFEDEGRTHVCYDGEAFRRVLALGGSGAARARAALALTDPSCVNPSLGLTAALALTRWRASVLDAVDPGAPGEEVPGRESACLRLRRSTVQSELAYLAARTGDFQLAQRASTSAKHELSLADASVFAEDDRLTYEEAAIHTATVRWADEPAAPKGGSSRLDIEVAAGSPGQTCVRLKDHSTPQGASFEHCTYGVVWPSSIRIAPHDTAVAMIVQPLDGWSELLVLHPRQGEWVADTLAPAAVDPELGYVELAGFSPDGGHLLVVREWRATGPLGSPHTLAPRTQRSFQEIAAGDLSIEKSAATLANFPTFRRWQAIDWQRGTLALR
jgi:hypothetical protein